MGRYSTELVGESNYQPAVKRLRVGDPIELRHEPDNRFDADAVCATDVAGRTIGYVPRGSWLQRVVAEDGTDVVARVRAIIGGEAGKPSLGVVLDVFTAADAEKMRNGGLVEDGPRKPAIDVKSQPAALGQIIEHRAPPRTEPPKPKGLLDGLYDAMFDGSSEPKAAQGRTVYVKAGPNSFQSCMNCLGLVILGIVVLMIFT